jgi:hypothetical protein
MRRIDLESRATYSLGWQLTSLSKVWSEQFL